jgi:tyrosyl-tRNA synthetase
MVLVGGGTGMIGDPSGKSEERNLLELETVALNAKAMSAQIAHVLGSSEFTIVNNADWLGKLKLLDFLRDIGKHLTINAMIKKDMVRGRLESEQPMSYTEFAYAPLQAYDFLHLHETKECDLQVGASDQWGNITAGIELVRKKTGNVVYGITAPLLVDKVTGKKFGKSEGGAVWLDANKTSPFSFYQFWFNADDVSVEEYLKKMTLLPLVDIEQILKEHGGNPAERIAQRALAREVTVLVHGEEAAARVTRVSEVMFGEGGRESLTEEEVHMLMQDAPQTSVRAGELLADVLVETGLAASKREARQFLGDGAITLNGARVSDANREMRQEDFQDAAFAIVRRGRRNVHILIEKR